MEECTEVLDEIFASRTLAEWREALATLEGVWAPCSVRPRSARIRRRMANGYLPAWTRATAGSTGAWRHPPGSTRARSEPLTGAPEHGQHTEDVLLELGLGWDDIVALKEHGTVM